MKRIKTEKDLLEQVRRLEINIVNAPYDKSTIVLGKSKVTHDTWENEDGTKQHRIYFPLGSSMVDYCGGTSEMYIKISVVNDMIEILRYINW